MQTESKFNRISVINCTTKLTQSAVEQIRALSKSEINFVPNLPTSESETIKAIDGSDAVIVSLSVDMTKQVFAGVPKLKYLGVCGSNLRRIDLKSASLNQVHVTSIHQYCDWDTSLFIITEILGLARGLGPKMWKGEPTDIRGKTLGILGLGAVGLATANLATSLGMEVRYFSRTRKPVSESPTLRFSSKEEVLASSDFVSVHTPPHLIVLDRDDFDRFRSGTVLINTAVGNTLEEQGFRDWVANPRNFAIFDSVAGEYCPKLNNSENVTISKRSAFLTTESRNQLCERVIREMHTFLKGAAR